MSVDVGSAVGYLDIDISGFLSGLERAMSQTESSKNKIESLGSKISGVGDKFTSVGSKLTKKVTTPILGLATASVTVASNFESSMSSVAAISGATGEELSALSDKAKEMGATTKFSASEAAEAMQYMAMAGWKTDDMLSGIEGIMSLAAASGEDLATTSDIVTDALTAFGLSAQDAGRFSDVLAAASSNANTNVSMLGESFKYVAPVAGSLGYTAEDTAIALSLMANAGIKGSQGGTALRGSLTRLIKPSKEAAGIMKEYGISLTNTDGSMKSLGDVMGMLREKLGGLSEAQQAQVAATLFGQESMSGMLAIINASEADYSKLTDAIYGSEGAATSMAETMQDNLSGQLTILKSTLEALAISFGDLLLPVIKDAVSFLQKLLTWINNLDEGQKKTIITIAGIVAVVGPVLLVVGKLISGVGSLVTTIGKATSFFGKFGGAASAAAAPAETASKGIGGLAKSAMNLLAAGAGILMASAGLALLAHSAISLAEAGWPAIAVMGGLVAAMALLAVGAAAIGPALTAGAVGLVAFGGAIALVGVGILAATSGVALLATQLPTIAQYGSQAASALLELGGGLLSLGGGAIAAGAGCAVLGTGLLAVGVGATAAAVGVVALGAAVVLLGAGVVVLGAGITLCGAGMTLLAASASTASAGITSFGAASLASVTGTAALTAGILALDAVVVTGLVTLGLLTVELGLSAANCGLLAAAMIATATTVSSIKSSADSAASSLNLMVTSVDVVKSGLSSLEAVVSTVMDNFVNTIKKTQNPAKTESLALANAIVTSINTGLATLPNQMSSTGSRSIDSFRSSMSSSIGGLSSEAHGWGQDVIRGLANGIESEYPTLRSAVNGAANIISSQLHFSVPDEGPLTTYESWMPDFIQGLSNGISSNLYRLKPAVNNLSKSLIPELPVGSAIADEVQAASNMESYNDTIIVTIGLYSQLLTKMREFSDISDTIRGFDNKELFAMSRAFTSKLGIADYETSNRKENNTRQAGDTFIFNSPKAIDEAEAARQMKRAKRDLTEGF